ncbi:DUF4271 domain-containing protein [Polaribacter sp. R77954]|uniref:DUF4271 domain-containing protein n=1 Tax=Polaribacter sp. R77954 TaxID=3093870 RepID=UPI0037C7228F
MQAVDKIVQTNDWVTLLFLILFSGIVVLKLMNPKKVKENFFAFFRFTIIEDEDLEGVSFFKGFQLLIFMFSVLVFSFLVYQFKLYKLPQTKTGLTVFLSILAYVLLYFIAKRILEYALLLLFVIKNRIQFFVYLKNSYLYSVSFLLYIALILFEYAALGKQYLLIFAVFLFVLRYVFLIARNKKLIFNKLFYFILYICALEIAPLFVAFKLMF